MATTVGVRDLKNSLSRWLRLVRGGENVIVLDHGMPIALLTAVTGPRASRTVAEHLASLAARGIVVLGASSRRARPKRLPKANLSGAVADDRGEHA